MSGSTEIVPNLQRLTQFARDRRIPILATACAHTLDDPELKTFPPHCLVGTRGQERVAATAWPGSVILDDHARVPETIAAHLTIQKHQFDIFAHPCAEELIALYMADNPLFVVYGVATDYCVSAAVDGLLARQSRVALVVDAIRAIDGEEESHILSRFARQGVLLTITEVVCARRPSRRIPFPPSFPPRRILVEDGGEMHDKFRKKYRVATATERLRRQIALEAARRLWDAAGPRDDGDSLDWLDDTTENDYYVAKRKAASVLGHRLRPGDLPSDAEVREQLLILCRSRSAQKRPTRFPRCPSPRTAKFPWRWPSISTASPSTG